MEVREKIPRLGNVLSICLFFRHVSLNKVIRRVYIERVLNAFILELYMIRKKTTNCLICKTCLFCRTILQDKIRKRQLLV